MNSSLDIQPFKDFWINCMFNMLYSVLISVEPSYRFAAYLNNYSYNISEIETPFKTKVNYLLLDPLKNFYEKHGTNLLFESQPITFKDNPNFTTYLKELIKQGKIVLVGVDLFYWIPRSICWKRYHWEHYSMINGFDDDKKVFYVFDENILGYDQYEIPEERFCVAVKNSPLEPHGFIYNTKCIKPFKLSLNEVAFYAERLMNELTITNSKPLWQLSDADYTAGHMQDLFSMYIFQIVNRHKANQLLFRTLQTQEIIPDSTITHNLIQYCQNLQSGWNQTKAKFMWTYVSKDKQSDIKAINEQCKALLGKEHEMWNSFLSSFTK